MQRIKSTLLAIGLLSVFAWVSTQDYHTNQLQMASAICADQTTVTMPTFEQCMANQQEHNNDH